MHKQYKQRADFKIVYVREAHPVDGWRIGANDREGIAVKDPKTLSDREAVAAVCATELKVSIPIVIDNVDDAVEKAYAGWPDRIYVVTGDGKIAYKGDPGPRGFRPKEAEEAMKTLLDAGGP